MAHCHLNNMQILSYNSTGRLTLWGWNKSKWFDTNHIKYLHLIFMTIAQVITLVCCDFRLLATLDI